MLIILKYVARLLKALSSEAKPWQIALGFVFGMIIGLTPLFSFHNLAILLLIIVIKVNVGIVIFSFLIFSGIAYLADPAFHNFGTWLLEKESYQSLWINMYNNEWWAMTRFYNTVVIGSFLSAIILSVPAFPLVIIFVNQYRKHIHERVQKWKLVKALKGTKLYSVYQTVSRVRG
ncbi:MAG: TIGR03546 family protein [Balneolales bacterium]|nr:TIGR03546 family protein [Balneolales bacterium]